MIRRRFILGEQSFEIGGKFNTSAHYTQRAGPVQQGSSHGQAICLKRSSSFPAPFPFPLALLSRCVPHHKKAGAGKLSERDQSDHCFVVRALQAHETVLPLYPFPSFCPPNLARRDLTGGANLGDRPPAAGSLHRAGCEDGRSPRFMTGPVHFFPPFSPSWPVS